MSSLMNADLALPVPDRLDSYEDLLDFLFSRKAAGIKLGLENTRLMLDRLGHPEAALTAFHIAGTNGKGSTSAILESILRAAGFRTGLYTSPHILDYRERIRVDGSPVSAEELLKSAQVLIPHLLQIPLSFFEITTVLAFLIFLARGVQVGVMEVGLGGRLDATNVMPGAFPVITDIHFDHERILGRRLAEIASEKAGIIRGTRPVVTGVRRRAVLDVFESRCRTRGVDLHALRDDACWTVLDLSWSGTAFRLETKKRLYEDLFLALPGEHQVANAALAVSAVEVMSETLGLNVDSEVVRRGLREVCWPGRLQVVRHRPRVVLDAAHNPGGAKALAAAMEKLSPGHRPILVLGMLREKKHGGVIRYLAPMARELIVTSPADERGSPAELLAEQAEALGYRARMVPDVGAAVQAGMAAAGPDGIVCVAGSCYTIGEALRSLGIEEAFPRDGETANTGDPRNRRLR